MKLTFTHDGREYALIKHQRYSDLPEAEQKTKPWRLRVKQDGKTRYITCPASDSDAITTAKDHLKVSRTDPTSMAAFMEVRDCKRGVTIGTLAAEWIKAGCPHSARAARTADAAKQVKDSVNRALRWYEDKPVIAVRPKMMSDYGLWRLAHTRQGFDGRRSIDVEHSALSSLCQWACLEEKIATNPFANWEPFQRDEDVTHCATRAPMTDEEWHAVLRWFLAFNPDAKFPHMNIVSGAWLAFTGLVGLRPEEPQFLGRYKTLPKRPTDTDHIPFGTIFPTHDGQFKMRVFRTKRSRENPYVMLPPVALDFLSTWDRWLAVHYPGRPQGAPLFPNPRKPSEPLKTVQGSLSKRVDACCEALKLKPLIPKGVGRAYYVRVRRAQGRTDSEIGVELGQSGNGELIRNVYGKRDQELASHALDWLPETCDGQLEPPAWKLLDGEAATNIIEL